MRRLSKYALYFSLIAVVSVLWIALSASGLLGGLERETLRWRYLVRGEVAPSPEVRYVDLDSKTVSSMGSRPWDRLEFARLLEALLGPGEARVVSLDIILSEIGAGSLLDRERARKGDWVLGQVVQAYPNQIILAAGYTGVETARGDGETAYLPLLRKGTYHPEMNPFPEAPAFPIINFELGRLALANVDQELSGGAIPYYVPGFVELRGDAYSQHLLDGVAGYFHEALSQPAEFVIEGETIRLEDAVGWVPQQYPLESSQLLLSLGLETYLAAEGLSAEAIRIGEETMEVFREGEVIRAIPLVGQQAIEVNWLDGWDLRRDHARVSMREVLRRAAELRKSTAAEDAQAVEAQMEWFRQFRDQVIFVGAVDPLLKDLAPTPFNREPVPKVGLHANVYRTVAENAFLQRPGMLIEGVTIFALTLSTGLLILAGTIGRLGAIGVLAAYAVACFFAFSHANFVLPLGAPVGSAFSAAFMILTIQLGTAQMQRRRIKTLFSAYVSPSLVNEMVDSEHDPELGGTEAEVTALFSDVEGFSSIAEELSPEQLVALMNEYLGTMTEAFQARQGTLDKYVGDAIVTMFGMPYPVEDHAARACLSAIEMQRQNASLREKWAASGRWSEQVTQIRTRIGLNSGSAVIGNMGSRLRFNYTMMGDSVNLAARCESGAKRYGLYTLVTESTYEAAQRDVPGLFFRKVDRIRVQGRRQAVAIYELWDETIPRAEFLACQEPYEAALEAYFAQDWSRALAGFEAAAAVEPWRDFAPTTPSVVLAERCRRFLREGTPPDWDGAFRMDQK
ncbi:MAG: CHASE2 domain-containing protein [Opitutales bacterium]